MHLAKIGKKRKPFTETHIKNMSLCKLGKKRKPFSKEHIRNITISARQRCVRVGRVINIGKREKQILDERESTDSCKIIRQYCIETLGYTVDGYCLETNTVYEVYERYHDYQVQKDLERENEICRHLGCDFIIIWDAER